MNPYCLSFLIGATALLDFAAADPRREPAAPREPRTIVLHPDDKPAFEAPPQGFNTKRDGIPHGRLEMVEYESKTVGTTRRMQVYTPPGFTKSMKLPVHPLHGIGGEETEWQRFVNVSAMMDNLIADGKGGRHDRGHAEWQSEEKRPPGRQHLCRGTGIRQL